MSVTLTVSEKIYKSLEQQAQKRELESVEQFLERLTEEFEEIESKEREERLTRRREVVDDILQFHEKMKEKYGVMPNNTPLIREDRMRG